MTALRMLLSNHEDWLVERVLSYSRKYNYVKFTSTLREAVRLAICGLSTSIFAATLMEEDDLRISLDTDFTNDPIVRFAVIEAQRHRLRGVSLVMFIGLLKYYRQSYRDLLIYISSENSSISQYINIVDLCFDRMEVGIFNEWTQHSESSYIKELQGINRVITNEKNKYLTSFDSIPTPIILLDGNNLIDNMNNSASEWIHGSNIPGSEYYYIIKDKVVGAEGAGQVKVYQLGNWAGKPVRDLFPWVCNDLEALQRDVHGCHDFEKIVETPYGMRWLHVRLSRIHDVSGKFGGALLIFEDITERKSAEEELGNHRDRLAEMVLERTAELESINAELHREVLERQRAEEAVRFAHDDLERRVVERTSELSIANRKLKEEIEERKRAEEALRENEERYRTIEELIPFGIWVCDPKGETRYLSDSLLKLCGTSHNEYMAFGLPTGLPDKERERILTDWRECVESGSYWDYEVRIQNEDGFHKTILSRGVPMRDTCGNTTCWLGINLDITDRKQMTEEIKASLREKEILLKEIHHRVKNNMQLITSLLKLQATYTREKQYAEMFRDSQNRIKAMSLIHETLYQSKDFTNIDFKSYVRKLVTGLFRYHENSLGAIDLSIDVEDVSMGLDNSITCGLIINELVSNSFKYAFPKRRVGTITIALKALDNSTLELVVGDDGVGIPADVDFRQTESLGLHLVTILAEDQLEGTIRLNRASGTRYHVVFNYSRDKARV